MFSYFDKSIEELTDSQLLDWYISFLNGADFNDPLEQQDFEIFHKEVQNRNEEFKNKVKYLDNVL